MYYKEYANYLQEKKIGNSKILRIRIRHKYANSFILLPGDYWIFYINPFIFLFLALMISAWVGSPLAFLYANPCLLD